MKRVAIAFVTLAACSGSTASTEPDASAADSGGDAQISTTDNDGDGLAEDYETQLASDYLPFLSIDPSDGCPLAGLVARVTPHPADATKILIVYSHLFQRDCGLAGHIGDNEAFGIAIDPARPAPAGLLAIKTASHQGTPCERKSECTTCSNDSRAKCDVASDGGAMWPVLYASKDKHGQYATKSSCGFGTCFDSCTLAAQRSRPPIVNVGEPAKHLVEDLTTNGFITAANGWTEATLQHFDPWSPTDFGGAGNVAGDLQDATFIPVLCR